jgi:hypothetical protein
MPSELRICVADIYVTRMGAFGIGGCAHLAALAVQGTTVAVLACGVDRDYPLGHCELFRSIREQGALVSEWPPGRMPTKPSFLISTSALSFCRGSTMPLVACKSAIDACGGSRDRARCLPDCRR